MMIENVHQRLAYLIAWDFDETNWSLESHNQVEIQNGSIHIAIAITMIVMKIPIIAKNQVQWSPKAWNSLEESVRIGLNVISWVNNNLPTS